MQSKTITLFTLKRLSTVKFSEVAIGVSPPKERLSHCIDIMSADLHDDLTVQVIIKERLVPLRRGIPQQLVCIYSHPIYTHYYHCSFLTLLY